MVALGADFGSLRRTMGEGTNPGWVLICDDEPRLAALTAGLLEQYGYESLLAESSEDAEAALEKQPADVMLLDASLRGTGALPLLQKLEATGRGLPVLLMSGYSEEDIPLELRRHGLVKGYLAKPFSVDKLVDSIRRVAE